MAALLTATFLSACSGGRGERVVFVEGDGGVGGTVPEEAGSGGSSGEAGRSADTGGSAGTDVGRGGADVGGSSNGSGGEPQGGAGAVAGSEETGGSGAGIGSGGEGGSGAIAGSGGARGGSAGASGVGGAGGSASSGGSGGSGGGSGGTGAAGALFVEDFEDGNYDGWMLGLSTSTYAVTSVTAADGSVRSMQITGGTGYFNGPNHMFGPIQPSRVSWWVRVAGSLGNDGEGYFVLSSDTRATQNLIYVFISRFAVSFEQFSVNSPAPVADHWYHFEVDIDWDAETYAAKVDGTSVGTGRLGGQPTRGIARLDIFNANAYAGDVVYWDQIVMMP